MDDNTDYYCVCNKLILTLKSIKCEHNLWTTNDIPNWQRLAYVHESAIE